VADVAERGFVSYLCAAAVIFHEVPEPVDVLSVDLAPQQFGNCFWLVIRVAHGKIQVGGEAAGVAGVQLAERGPSLEDQVIEYSLPAQLREEEVLRDVDEGCLPPARALWCVAGQPARGNPAHADSSRMRGSKGRSPSATLKRLS
jgi:hypothetical protein